MEGIGFRAAFEYFIREIRYMHMQQKVFCNISRSHFLMFFQIWPSWTSRICFLACTRENSYYICPLFCLHELALTFVALMNFINMFSKADTAWKCITPVIASVSVLPSWTVWIMFSQTILGKLFATCLTSNVCDLHVSSIYLHLKMINT